MPPHMRPDAEHCFAGNSRQLSRIAELLINNVGCISSLTDARPSCLPRDADTEALDEVRRMAGDLMNWIRRVQFTHGLRDVASATPRCRADLRQERNYSMPMIINRHPRLEVRTDDDTMPARPANFSRHGIRFITPRALAFERPAHSTLSTGHMAGNSLSFTARLMYCKLLDEACLLGECITEVSRTADFIFFTSVLEFMREVHGECRA